MDNILDRNADVEGMAIRFSTHEQILREVETDLTTDAKDAAGKGGVLSKAEQAKLLWPSVLNDAARDLRAAKKTVRVPRWVDAASGRVAKVLDEVDKPGRGHGRISLVEAREAATKGDAGSRIARAFERVTGQSLDPKGPPSADLQKAVTALTEAERFGVLTAVGDRQPSAWVQMKIEKALEDWGGDGLMTLGAIKVGGETVNVATTIKWENDQLLEMIGFFDKEGRTLARAQITRNDETFALEMRAAALDGTAGAVLAEVPARDAAMPSQEWIDGLKASVQPKYEDSEDLGVPIKRSQLPKEILAAFEFAERNTPDGVGLERIDFEGQTAYAIHDYSCVSSVAIYAAGGQKLFGFVD